MPNGRVGGGEGLTQLLARHPMSSQSSTPPKPHSLSQTAPPPKKKKMEGKGAETTNIHFIVYSAYSLQYCGEHSMGCRASFRK